MNKKIISKILDNGLQIYFYPDSTKHSVFMDFIVLYGAFHSDFTVNNKNYHMNNGMAHLIEHLLFEKNQYGNFANFFGNLGMKTNATTSTYMTDFFVDTVEDAEKALEYLIKGISKPVFTKEDIEEIKPAIYQEIRMRNDEIGRSVYKSHTKNMLLNYSYIDGLGTKKNVEDITYEQVKLCYDIFYQPKNEILFIAGNFDVDKIFLKIKKIYETLSFKMSNFSYLKIEEPLSIKKRFQEIVMPTPKEYACVCYKLDFSSYSREQRRMLSYYLGFFLGENFSIVSSLYKKLIKEKIIESPLSCNFNFFEDILLISIGGFTNNRKILVKNIRNVLENKPAFNEKLFYLDLKSEKMKTLCSDVSFYSISRNLKENISYFNSPCLDSVEDLQSLNFRDFQKFIKDLNFKEYFVTTVTDVK